MREVDAGLIDRARRGDRAALEDLLRTIQHDVYGMALRMLWHPDDAQDASQEILLKVLTHLGAFRGASRFSTWVYRIAANHLQDFRKGRLESRGLDFEAFSSDLAEGLAAAEDEAVRSPEHMALLDEIRIGCTLGMLACLDRAHRVAYILGEILGLDQAEAASALNVTPEVFRKRLSRSRRAVQEFLHSNCGIVDAANGCRCARRLPRAIELGRVDPAHLLFSRGPADATHSQVVTAVRSLEGVRRAAALMRSSGTRTPDLAAELISMLTRAETSDR